MTPHTINSQRHDREDPDARYRRISDRILDGIEQTLDELARPARLRAAIDHAVAAHCAPLLCSQALCRRAKRCRRQPCTVPAASLRASNQ
jgi:hypothetical protein